MVQIMARSRRNVFPAGSPLAALSLETQKPEPKEKKDSMGKWGYVPEDPDRPWIGAPDKVSTEFTSLRMTLHEKLMLDYIRESGAVSSVHAWLMNDVVRPALEAAVAKLEAAKSSGNWNPPLA